MRSEPVLDQPGTTPADGPQWLSDAIWWIPPFWAGRISHGWGIGLKNWRVAG